MKKPIVHAYFVCFNEANILPHLLKYYLTFCEKVIIVDNNSNDNSIDIIKSFNNVELIPFNSNETFDDGINLKIKNNVWKQSIGLADYVIVGDTDEFLWHENMAEFLINSFKNNITLFKPEGYHMVADEDFNLKSSDNIFDFVKFGVRVDVLDKMMMFNCNKININYNFGCHSANPVGEIKLLTDKKLKMLHFKFLGLNDHKLKYKMREGRLSEFNKKNGFGLYYLFNEEEQINDYKNYLNKRIKILK